MTWVSERSGMASSGTCRTHQTAPPIATRVRSSTRNRFRALSSMTRSIMSVGVRRRRRPRERGQRRAEAGLRVDEEVRRGHHRVAVREAGAHLVVALGLAAELDGAWLELALALDDEHDPMLAGVEHGALGYRQHATERHLDPGGDEGLG